MEDRYNVECCDLMHAHDEIVERVQKEMPGEDTLYDLTELFRIFGDSTRIRILYVLFEAEMCVCDIAALLGMTQSAISHQLKVLKNARLVKSSASSVSFWVMKLTVALLTPSIFLMASSTLAAQLAQSISNL